MYGFHLQPVLPEDYNKKELYWFYRSYFLSFLWVATISREKVMKKLFNNLKKQTSHTFTFIKRFNKSHSEDAGRYFILLQI